MIKRVISLVIFLLMCNAAYRLGTVYFHDQEFKDAVREEAILAGQPPPKTDDVVRAKVVLLALQYQIPLDPDYLEVSRHSAQGWGEKITVKFSYAVNVAVLPGYERRFDFDYITP